jgi:hypothetical protein
MRFINFINISIFLLLNQFVFDWAEGTCRLWLVVSKAIDRLLMHFFWLFWVLNSYLLATVVDKALFKIAQLSRRQTFEHNGKDISLASYHFVVLLIVNHVNFFHIYWDVCFFDWCFLVLSIRLFNRECEAFALKILLIYLGLNNLAFNHVMHHQFCWDFVLNKLLALRATFTDINYMRNIVLVLFQICLQVHSKLARMRGSPHSHSEAVEVIEMLSH